MKRLLYIAAIAAATVMQGCDTSFVPSLAAQPVASSSAKPPADNSGANAAPEGNPEAGIAMCATPGRCESNGRGMARGDEIGVEKNAPPVEGHPLTSVVVTQCNLVVAVYMTMPDGRLLRFDQKANVAAEDLVSMAYTATRSERVEVSCNGLGSSGFETHEPT